MRTASSASRRALAAAHPCHPHPQPGIASLLVGLSLLLAACASSVAAPPPGVTRTTSAASTQAAAAPQAAVATATRAAAPVWVDVTATVQGSAAQHNARLQVSVMVTNRTEAAIHLSGSCEHPPIHLEIRNPVTSYLWTDTGNFCASSPPFDLQPPVAASSSYTWSYSLDLENVPDADSQLVPGAYSVLAQIRLWHQGAFDQLNADPTLPHGAASDQTIVRLP